MQEITIDGVSYQLDALSQEARQQLTNVQVTDSEIARLQAQLAMLTTARAAYASALKDVLPAQVQ